MAPGWEANIHLLPVFQEPLSCEKGGSGLFLPLFGDAEQEGDKGVRAFFYAASLCYCFLGVNVISDYFMNAITAITSQKKRVVDPKTGRKQTLDVWNSTIANLTLLALGSSAPEIMLACMETLSRDFYAGSLGPGTIVGSAAFNLLVIVPVCMVFVGVGNILYIEQFEVYVVTVVFSLFAYIWLLFIVAVSSPDVVEPWEAILTVLWMPLLVGLSYYVDITNGCKKETAEDSDKLLEAGAAQGNAAEESVAQRASVVGQRVPKEVKRLSMMTGARPAEAKGRQSCRQSDSAALVDAEADLCKKPICDASARPIVQPAGILAFPSELISVNATSEMQTVNFTVHRRNGAEGTVKCSFKTERGTAVPDYDYVEAKGDLEFEGGQTSAEIPLEILPSRDRRPHRQEGLRLILEDMQGDALFNPYDDGGEKCAVLTVNIMNESLITPQGEAGNVYLSVRERFVDGDLFRLGLALWKQQIIDSLSMDGGGDDDGGEEPTEESQPSLQDRFFFVLSLPWNLFYACTCPPALWGGGWCLFCMALFHIAISCGFIGDLASLFGCCAGVDDSITAITFVALGTSLPDMFASITAASEEDSADASIVNVTGSNSVNVFLGIGLPWTLCSLYWGGRDLTLDWAVRYPQFLGTDKEGKFVVLAGDIDYSVSVFTSCAVIALVVLRIKRVLTGGELGGSELASRGTAAFMVSLWLLYLILSIWNNKSKDDAKYGKIIIMIFGCIAAVVLVVFEVLVIMGHIETVALGGGDESNTDENRCEDNTKPPSVEDAPHPQLAPADAPKSPADVPKSQAEDDLSRQRAAVKIQAIHRGRAGRAKVDALRGNASEAEKLGSVPKPVSVGKPSAEGENGGTELKKKKKADSARQRGSVAGASGTTKKPAKKKANKDVEDVADEEVADAAAANLQEGPPSDTVETTAPLDSSGSDPPGSEPGADIAQPAKTAAFSEALAPETAPAPPAEAAAPTAPDEAF